MALAGTGAIVFILLVDRREFLSTHVGPYMYTLGASGLGLACGALVGSSQYTVPLLTSLLNGRVLKNFGKYSDGIYVYHPAIMWSARKAAHRAGISTPLPTLYAFAALAALIAVAFGVAWVSYRLIESRFLRMKRRFEPVYASVDEDRLSPVNSVS
jgi:peptidoglycan/LPS O-acetylase OafA/YrhL